MIDKTNIKTTDWLTKGITDEQIAREKREAINCINDVLNSEYHFDESLGYQLTSDDFEWLEEAKKALEKQIPKRLTHEATLYECCTCPNCKNVIDRFEKWGENTVRITYKYCHYCGQKLDWRDHSTEKGGKK